MRLKTYSTDKCTNIDKGCLYVNIHVCSGYCSNGND